MPSADFFPPGLIALVTDAWDGDLGGLVQELPPFERALAELRPAIPLLLGQEPVSARRV
jgi:hypothetical protein